MADAIDQLVARSKDDRELRRFHKLHRDHPELLDFLVQEIRARLKLFAAFSYRSLWEYARWKLEMEKGPGDTFLMNDHCVPFYARAITILYPEFNRKSEFRKCPADEIFGIEIEPAPKKRPKNYACGLQWADGTALESGWRPNNARVPKSVRTKPSIHRMKSAGNKKPAGSERGASARSAAQPKKVK